jgi:uncharacterized protein YecE (DUF72 family)
MATRTPHIRIGISGWRYEPWRGVFYPPGLAQRRELEFASRMLGSIEINGSFYSLQRPEDYARWRDETPPGFVFAVKAPRYLTHRLRLKNIDAAMANFLASGLFELRDKLGPLLWQFPPQMSFEEARWRGFLAALPRSTDEAAAIARRHDARVEGRAALDPGPDRPLRHAVEIRHASFAGPAFAGLLREHGVALVIADTAGRWPLCEDLTAGFVYLRLHGDKELYASGYDDAALDRWAARIRLWSRGRQPDDARLADPYAKPARGARDVYVYFDNDIKVHAPYDAARLSQRLGVAHGLREDGRFDGSGFAKAPAKRPRRPRRDNRGP